MQIVETIARTNTEVTVFAKGYFKWMANVCQKMATDSDNVANTIFAKSRMIAFCE